MKQTFKQYLITEKVHASTYREILADRKFKIGLEFEYYDKNLRDRIVDEYADYSGVSEHEDYLHFDEEAEKSFVEYVKKIEALQDSFDASKYEKMWQEERKETADEVVRDLETSYQKFVTRFNKKHGTSYKILTFTKEKELEQEYVDYQKTIATDTDKKLKERQWRMYKMQNYGLYIGSDRLPEEPEIWTKFKTNRDINRHIKNQDYSKVGAIPMSMIRFGDYLNEKNAFEKEGVKIPEIPEILLHTMNAFPSINIDKAEIKKQFMDDVRGVIGDDSLDFKSELGTFAEAFDESEYEYINSELEDTMRANSEARNFDEAVKLYFNHEDFPFEIDATHNYSDDTEWNIVEDGSLTETDGGAEIISPILSLQDGLRDTQLVFEYITQNGHTGSETGFHVNLSYKTFNMDNLDVFKMMLFMEEGAIEKFFPGRMDSGWAASVRTWMIEGAAGRRDRFTGLSASEYKNLKQQIINQLMPRNDKSTGINRVNAFGEDGRIEFRYLGGRNYNKKYERIQTFILRFCYLLKLGMEPNFKKREYDSKLLKLIEKYSSETPSYRERMGKRGELYLTDTKTGDRYYSMVTRAPGQSKQLVVQYGKDTNGNEVFKAKHPMIRIQAMGKSDKNRYEFFND